MRPYRWLVRCCYLGMFVQAMVINLTPLLFIPLREQFGLTFEQIGRLILINFLTQMFVDLVCTAIADRVPIKPLVVAANILAAVGLCLFATAPFLLADPYTGLVIGTIAFSIGCGLLEVLLSPIINAVPSERKSGDMAILHAFYPIGKVAVIVITAIALQFAGVGSWPWIVALWAIVPLVNTFGFLAVDLPGLNTGPHRQTIRKLIFRPATILLLIAMVLAGATEVTVAQWTSAYVEQGLGFSKLVADLVGFGLFGVGMIIGRLWFGFHGDHGNLSRVMSASAALSCAACVVMSLAPNPWVALAACATSGLFVSMLWPGTISLATSRFPLAGASLFALLAAAGDAGGAFVPWAVGIIADSAAGWQINRLREFFGPDISPESFGLRVAFLIAALCPLVMLPTVRLLHRVRN